MSELHWAAGFYDGEGSCCLPKSKYVGKPYPYYCSLVVQISQSRREPLERFVAALGEGKINGPYDTGKLPAWTVTFKGEAACTRIKNLLYPLCSEPKREQFDKAWEAWREYQLRPRLPRKDKGIKRGVVQR